jgi:hypothetical protein
MYTMSKDYVDTHEARVFDSVEDFNQFSLSSSLRNLNYTVAGSGYVNATTTLTLIDGDLQNTLAIGDRLLINAAGTARIAQVATIPSATTCTVTGLAADIAAGSVLTVNVIGDGIIPTRRRVMDDTAHRFCLKLDQVFCNQRFYLPLPLLLKYGALELEIIWERADLGIVINAAAAADHRIAYRLEDLKMHTSMVYPSQDIIEKHLELYKQPTGILVPFQRYDVQAFQIGNGTVNLSLQTNKNSISRVFGVIVDNSLAISSATASQTHFAQSTFYKRALESFQVKVGSSQFPDYGKLETAGPDNWLSFEHVMEAVGRYNRYLGDGPQRMMVAGSRARPDQWAANQGDKFVVGVPMSKDQSFYSGASARMNSVSVNLTGLNGVGANDVLILFIVYDVFLQVGEQGGVVLYE